MHHATAKTQHATAKTQHATAKTQHATAKTQHAPSKTQRIGCGLQHTTAHDATHHYRRSADLSSSEVLPASIGPTRTSLTPSSCAHANEPSATMQRSDKATMQHRTRDTQRRNVQHATYNTRACTHCRSALPHARSRGAARCPGVWGGAPRPSRCGSAAARARSSSPPATRTPAAAVLARTPPSLPPRRRGRSGLRGNPSGEALA